MTRHHTPGSILALLAALTLGAPAFFGCEKNAEAPATDAHGHDDHGHDHAPGDDHDHGDAHDHGPTVELGMQSIGAFAVKASRDGDLTPGSDAPVDVWITGGSAKIVAVRFWIGAQDGKGSLKARADLEKDHWHTHAEIPNPLPESSKLWVEIETEGGQTAVTGFDLKGQSATQ